MTEVGGDSPYAYLDNDSQVYRFKILEEEEPGAYDFAVPVKAGNDIILMRAEAGIQRTFNGSLFWGDSFKEHVWYSLPFKASEGVGVDGWIIQGSFGQTTTVLPGTNVRMYPALDEGDLCFPVDVDGKKVLFKFEAKEKNTLWLSGTSSNANKIAHAVYDTTGNNNRINVNSNMFTPIKKHDLYNGIKQMHPWRNGITILKEDNTVWRIGPHGYNNQTYGELTPILNEDGSDLIRDAIQVYGCTVLRADGSVWSWIDQEVWTSNVNIGKRRPIVRVFPEGVYLRKFDGLPKISKIFYTDLLRTSFQTSFAAGVVNWEYYRAEDGTILCSGQNGQGQLCVGDYSGPGSAPFTPAHRYEIGTFSGGETADELIFLTGRVFWLSGGALYGCGNAASLQLPGYGWNADTENTIFNDDVPFAVPIDTGYVGLAADSNDQVLFAWRLNGTAAAIGLNRHGEMGGNLLKTISGFNAGGKVRNPYLEMTNITGLSDVEKIVTVNRTSFVLTKSGKIFAAGLTPGKVLVDNIFDIKQGLYEPYNAAEEDGTPYFQQVIDGFPVNSYNRTFLPENNPTPNSGTPIQDRYSVFVYKKPNTAFDDYDYAQNELEGKDYQTGTWRLNDIDPITGKLIGEWEWEKKHVEDANELWVQPSTSQALIPAVYVMRESGRSPNVPDFVEEEIEDFYIDWVAIYDCEVDEWVLTSSRSIATAATDWIATETGYKITVENDYFEPDTSGLVIPDCYYTWEAVYNCETEQYDLTRLSTSKEGTTTEWELISSGVYHQTTTVTGEPPPPLIIPDCYYTWEAVYNCNNQTWSLSLVVYSLTGTVTDWVDLGDGVFEITITEAGEPLPPSEAPTCYYTWGAQYNCYIGAWELYLIESSASGTASDWTEIYSNYYETTVTEAGEPAPPEGEGTCYYYWTAETFDYGATWNVYLSFVDEFGTVSDWDCYNFGGGYCECGATTTSSTPPPAPTYVCE